MISLQYFSLLQRRWMHKNVCSSRLSAEDHIDQDRPLNTLENTSQCEVLSRSLLEHLQYCLTEEQTSSTGFEHLLLQWLNWTKLYFRVTVSNVFRSSHQSQ